MTANNRPLSAEQRARDLLERMGIEDAQSFRASDLTELANVLADLQHYKALAAPALAQPEPEDAADDELPPRVGHILRLAEIIREVDGNHDKGAAALAEAILSHPGIRSAGLAAAPEVGEWTDEELYDLTCEYDGEPVESMRAAIAADRQRRVVPVAVSERLPGPEERDLTDEELDSLEVAVGERPPWPHWLVTHTHTLPQPPQGGEVQP